MTVLDKWQLGLARRKRRTKLMLKGLLLAAALATGNSHARPESLPEQIEATPPAVSVTGVTLGSHVDTLLRTPVPKTIFKPTDTIHVSIATRVAGSDRVPGTIGVLWTYGQGDELQAVHDDSREVVFEGRGQTEFHISKPDNWPEGEYAVEVFLDGVSVRKASFTVR